MTAKEFADHWRDNACPETLLCPLTGQFSRPVFVDVDLGPDETEGDDELEAAE